YKWRKPGQIQKESKRDIDRARRTLRSYEPRASRIVLRIIQEITTNREVEVGFEKVAIYINLKEMLPGHVAKSDGRSWKSKLGRYQDVEHASLDLLEGDKHGEYGIVERILKRPIRRVVRRKQKAK
ncbi:MAG: hypothetical protein ABSB35_41860, partial [Bryobacteraceae bacterium]